MLHLSIISLKDFFLFQIKSFFSHYDRIILKLVRMLWAKMKIVIPTIEANLCVWWLFAKKYKYLLYLKLNITLKSEASIRTKWLLASDLFKWMSLIFNGTIFCNLWTIPSSTLDSGSIRIILSINLITEVKKSVDL